MSTRSYGLAVILVVLAAAVRCGSSTGGDEGADPDAASGEDASGSGGSGASAGTSGRGGAASGGMSGGGGTSSGGTSSGGTSSGGTAGSMMADGGADASMDECASALEGEPCANEGTFCGGPCSDPCSFCNVLRCQLGTWQRMEAFPAPCFDCGPENRCMAYDTYCDVSYSDVSGVENAYECRNVPEPCMSDPSCACFEGVVPSDGCTDGLPGEVTVEHFGG